MGLAQNEMKAKTALPERVRSMEGLGVGLGTETPWDMHFSCFRLHSAEIA